MLTTTYRKYTMVSRNAILRANLPQGNVMTRCLKEILNPFRHEEKVRAWKNNNNKKKSQYSRQTGIWETLKAKSSTWFVFSLLSGPVSWTIIVSDGPLWKTNNAALKMRQRNHLQNGLYWLWDHYLWNVMAQRMKEVYMVALHRLCKCQLISKTQ